MIDFSGVEVNFNKLSTELVKTQGVTYDYNSVMHYSAYAFSRNGRPTIEPKDRSVRSSSLGQRAGLSNKDIQHANALYCTGIEMMTLTIQHYCSHSFLSQWSQPAGVPGGPGALAVEPATEEFALAIDCVREAPLVWVATHRSRHATPSRVRSRPSGPPGVAGVAAVPAVEEVDRPGVDNAAMETHVPEHPLSTGAATQ